MQNEQALPYPVLLVEGRFTPETRNHQVQEAKECQGLFFTAEIVPDKRGTDQKMMHLQGEVAMGNGVFREPEAIRAFLIDKGFIPESIFVNKDGTLYATHPREHLPFMHWIVRLLVHFQTFGEWLAVKYWYGDYPDK
ncbi:hypothetical protein N7V09_14260 [Shewanella seohaensis]|uniref:hypothetical protein n=1 Tax=Shewanella seohaensis TaxID=755175 RepID=UPI00200D5E8F|nr:hypothetical protein [Shewanella seohaensis]MCL1122008.1 hypothetical protein [Shewanella seohaensis]UXM81011.1 hypothetical protein N7V09_14260 [Shewanella seohaensis]